MTLIQVIIFQIIAHLLSDYIFQTNEKAKDKDRYGFNSEYLKYHIIVTFLLSWVLSFQLEFIIASFTISIVHYVVDGFKNTAIKNNFIKRYIHFIDQIIHIMTIVSIIILFDKIIGLDSLIKFPFRTKYLLIIAAYLICTKPVNIIIKEILTIFNIKINTPTTSEIANETEIDNNDELLNAGKLIGITERFLVLTFVIIGQFEAVGFLIAAKSILRFKDNSTIKTEYVLVGTMLSFGIAIAIGIGITLI